MKDALKPNLVQTLEHCPAFVHGGPFANIAHGCNSIMATRLSMKMSDYTITEAGFGADLGAEKFLDIKCRMPSVCREAEILIAAAGQKEMVTADYMNPEQVIIDVGINVDEAGKLCGDVNAEDAEAHSGAYTPVPGGVGTVTTSLLMKHTVEAAKKKI